MPVKERLTKLVLTEVIPVSSAKPDLRVKPLVIKDLIDFKTKDIKITSFRPNSIHSGRSEVTCLTKCLPCLTDNGYPKLTCTDCTQCDNGPDPAARFAAKKK